MRGWAQLVLGGTFVLAIVGALVLAATGMLPWPLAIDALAILAASLSLLALVKIPWDLWFAARVLVVEQAESVARGIAVPDAARLEAARIASRALALALALHVGAALAAFALSAMFGEPRGHLVAFAYLASMGLRPLQAGWAHVRARISALRSDAFVPREDRVTLLAELRSLSVDGVEQRERLSRVVEQLEKETQATREREAQLERRLDRLLVEIERSAERLTEDRALVDGLRALARMLRSPSAG